MVRRKVRARADVGIIGGSGLYDIEGLRDVGHVTVRTPFGAPSDAIVLGELNGIPIAFLSRHGRGHRIGPGEINYRANIYALKSLGVRRVISVSAVGSMKESIKPGDIVLPDQFIDLTKHRVSTFFESGIVAHVGFAEPVCGNMSASLFEGAQSIGASVHRGGVYLCIEGPQFSTKGESRLFRQWGVSVIGMTNMPEAKLAREAELCYATVALVTDYDCWHDEHDAVSVEAVVANLMKNVATAREVLSRVIPLVPESCAQGCPDALKTAVITDPRMFPPRVRRKLALLLDRHFPPRPAGRRRA